MLLTFEINLPSVEDYLQVLEVLLKAELAGQLTSDYQVRPGASAMEAVAEHATLQIGPPG